MTIKEINTYSFIGNLGGHEPKREWKEIDEDRDVINCTETFERPCLLLKPLSVLTTSLAGENGEERRLPVLSNDDVSIELATGASAEPAAASRDRHLVCVQVSGSGIVPTAKGDFELAQGELLALPPGTAGANPHGGTRLVVYTRKPLHVAKGYPANDERTTAADCLLLKPGEVLDQVEEGLSGGQHFELIENEDLMVEMTVRARLPAHLPPGFQPGRGGVPVDRAAGAPAPPRASSCWTPATCCGSRRDVPTATSARCSPPASSCTRGTR